ncbi:CidA/LrgA family protein [Alistipes ihumii]|uniref:CidA/LrgA family protein n=1 Tax=Alistipes ihumii TaxID=1470347 RepID=UPI003C6D25E8
MYGLFLILLFYLLGCLVSALLDNFIPGSVIGMILIDHMMLFFIPVGVGLITSYTLLSRYMTAIIVASLVSTVLVIAAVGLVEQKLESKRRREEKR